MAWRRFLDSTRAEQSRRRREDLVEDEPDPGPVSGVDDTLRLYFLCAHPSLTPSSAVALTLRAMGGLTTRQIAQAYLLALMLLHHARRPARTAADGRLVPLAQQDRSLWDTASIGEGVALLRGALARDRLGEYQAQAAIAALHADAPSTQETDWVQIVEWYDELAAVTDNPVALLNRAVAVGEADGPRAGLTAVDEPRRARPPDPSGGSAQQPYQSRVRRR